MSKKTLSWIAGLIAVFCILTGFSQPDIEDQAHILNKETRNLITAKNARYWQTGEQPQIVVKTVNRLDKLTPKALNKSDKTVFIVVGVKGKKRNVQIYSTKDLHGAFTAEVRMNIIRAEADKLRSSNNATFNQGLRFVFRAVATKIDQEYQYTLDKYDLSDKEQSKISHPHKVVLPIALALALVVMSLVYLFRRVRSDPNNQ